MITNLPDTWVPVSKPYTGRTAVGKPQPTPKRKNRDTKPKRRKRKRRK